MAAHSPRSPKSSSPRSPKAGSSSHLWLDRSPAKSTPQGSPDPETSKAKVAADAKAYRLEQQRPQASRSSPLRASSPSRGTTSPQPAGSTSHSSASGKAKATQLSPGKSATRAASPAKPKQSSKEPESEAALLKRERMLKARGDKQPSEREAYERASESRESLSGVMSTARVEHRRVSVVEEHVTRRTQKGSVAAGGKQRATSSAAAKEAQPGRVQRESPVESSPGRAKVAADAQAYRKAKEKAKAREGRLLLD